MIDIKRTIGLLYSTINATLKKYKRCTSGTSDTHSKRPNTLTESNKELIYLLFKPETYITIGEIFQALDKSVSTDTVPHMLKESEYTHVKAWKETAIKLVNKPTNAIQWPFMLTDWAYEQWTKIIWSYVYWRAGVREFVNERPVFLSFDV